jgi:hypothetical protein
MSSCAIVVNTCPKYFYLLEGYFGLIRRYAEKLDWDIYLATEKPDDSIITRCIQFYKIKIIKLDESSQADFFESRVSAIEALPSNIKYVLPLQDDFLLERPGANVDALKNAIEILDTDSSVLSLRLMPCPGSSGNTIYKTNWKKLEENDLHFSYQATIWRREVYMNYFKRLIQQGRDLYPNMTSSEWNTYAIKMNPAETFTGLNLLKLLYPTSIHLCWSRVGSWANAVYWCPWPYRPTAVVQGVLQPWAEELIKREGFSINKPSSKST